MAKKKAAGTPPSARTADYRHTYEKRTNIPPAKIVAKGTVPKVPKARYHYNPHLPPVLRFDPTGSADLLPELIAEAGRRPLKTEEQRLLTDALSQQQPWLEWAGKQEEHDRSFFEVEPVALHIHERLSTQAIVHAAMREDVQRKLFADPEQPHQEAVQFYRHDIDWTNRLILGDSLQVMCSLSRRENLAGKVKMIYIDPPYAVNYKSNFQPQVLNREVKDKDSDLTREPEVVNAYRDTWRLGVHSYLSYLRDRLIAAKELLSDQGSIFVQISEENVNRVHTLMDEIFGANNAVVTIIFKKKGATTPTDPVNDFILWFAKDRSQLVVRRLYEERSEPEDDPKFNTLVSPLGEHWRPQDRWAPEAAARVRAGWRWARVNYPIVSQHYHEIRSRDFMFRGRPFKCGRDNQWRFDPETDLTRLADAERLFDGGGDSLGGIAYWSDWAWVARSNMWDDLHGEQDVVYAVQTNRKVLERCILMTTEPGELVLDPTCGSGTTAYVAEQFGRRWITIDTSRVAVAITRQRLLTARFEHYQTKGGPIDGSENPGSGFEYKKATHITLKSIAQNTNLDPILAKHAPLLEVRLKAANDALARVTDELRGRLTGKMAAKERGEGKSAITQSERRRWVLPRRGWGPSEMPFDTDPDWPKELQDAVTAYRRVWLAKMADVTSCIEANAGREDLLDQPQPVKGVVRVSGPFTVEGARPVELSLDEHGLLDGAPAMLVGVHKEMLVERQNVNAYLTQMVQHLRADGVTFLGNKHRKFGRIEPLFETATGNIVHAEGVWEGQDASESNTVAVGFGPQHGPVTAEQVEDLVGSSARYDELVIAGFSFDAAASAAIQEASDPKLRIHPAYIRPDINPGMEGLLKDTGQSQLFTVFGQPEIKVQPADDGQFIVTLEGVDVYDPIENSVRSTGADKVGAWFLDSDYDGRCFCITQAFFPRQGAWEKIAKALGGSADAEAFAAFGGTTSLPFGPGKHRRIAVKVIDPRGNEVMTIRPVKA